MPYSAAVTLTYSLTFGQFVRWNRYVQVAALLTGNFCSCIWKENQINRSATGNSVGKDRWEVNSRAGATSASLSSMHRRIFSPGRRWWWGSGRLEGSYTMQPSAASLAKELGSFNFMFPVGTETSFSNRQLRLSMLHLLWKILTIFTAT